MLCQPACGDTQVCSPEGTCVDKDGADGGAADMAGETQDLTMPGQDAGADMATMAQPDLTMLPDLARPPMPDLIVTCPSVETEPNDFYNVANPLCIGTGVTGTIDKDVDVDWFTFQLHANDTYTVALTNLPWDYTFNVYHVDGGNLTLYFSANDFHDLSDQVETYISANGGTYAVKVYSYWGDSDAKNPYDLSVTVQ
jgi:hypothetical protein